MRGVCFALPARFAPRRHDAPLRLTDQAAMALADLAPLLGCGEEAAAIAFDALAQGSEDAAAATALRLIGEEERIHDALIAGLREALPAPQAGGMWLRTSRRFHANLSAGGATSHLARIAALDSAVCLVLSRLTARGTPIARDPALAAVLTRIRDDEARHVKVSRRLALARSEAGHLREIAAEARVALAASLALAAASFEALGVDPAILLSDISALPDGLLRA